MILLGCEKPPHHYVNLIKWILYNIIWSPGPLGIHYSEVRLSLWFSLPDQTHWELGKPCLYLCLLWLVLVISWVGTEISSLCWLPVDKLMIATLEKARGENWSFSLLLWTCLHFPFPSISRGVKLSWNLIYIEIIVCHFIKVGNENRLFSLTSIFNQFHELAFLILEKWSPNSRCQLSI